MLKKINDLGQFEYCNECSWAGPYNKILATWDEHGKLVVKCPKCEADITYNMPRAKIKRSIGLKFFLYLFGSLLIIVMYSCVQSFLLVAWILSAGRSGSPLAFHRDCVKLLKRIPETY